MGKIRHTNKQTTKQINKRINKKRLIKIKIHNYFETFPPGGDGKNNDWSEQTKLSNISEKNVI